MSRLLGAPGGYLWGDDEVLLPHLTVYDPETYSSKELQPKPTGLLDHHGKPILRPVVAPERRPVGFLHPY